MATSLKYYPLTHTEQAYNKLCEAEAAIDAARIQFNEARSIGRKTLMEERTARAQLNTKLNNAEAEIISLRNLHKQSQEQVVRLLKERDDLKEAVQSAQSMCQLWKDRYMGEGGWL